jgi:hypothetical protein
VAARESASFNGDFPMTKLTLLAVLFVLLAVLFIAYGAWMVLANPLSDWIINAIPFVFWVLLFGALAVWARRRARARQPND